MGIGASTEVVDENVSAEHEYPNRKNEKTPLHIKISKQKEQCQSVTKEADVAGREPGIDGDRRDRKHEHACHFDGIDVHEIGYQCSREGKHAKIRLLI